MKIARNRGMKKAIVALARRLALILLRIWVDGTDFRWTRRSQPHESVENFNAVGENLELHQVVERCPSRDDG